SLRFGVHQTLPPPAQIEFDQFVQTQAALQQLRRAALLDGPGDVRAGHRAPQRRKRWQRVNDIADGAELDDQNTHCLNVRASSIISCPLRINHQARSPSKIHFTASSKSSAM